MADEVGELNGLFGEGRLRGCGERAGGLRLRAAKAKAVEVIEQGHELFGGNFAHDTDLNPIASAQVFAVATEEETGFLELGADSCGVEFARQGNREDCGCGSVVGTDEVESEFAKPGPQPGCQSGQFGVARGPFDALDGGVKGMHEIGGLSEGDALMLRIEREVEIAGNAIGRRREFVVVEDEAQAGERAQAFAAAAGGEINAFEIHGHGADGADAIEAEFYVVPGAESFQRGEVVEHAGGGFAMGAPEPAAVVHGFQLALNCGEVEGFSPRMLDVLELELESTGVVGKADAKFAIAQDEAGFVFKRELRGDGVVGQCAGAEEDFDAAGAGELAEEFAGGLKVGDEGVGTMGFGDLLKGAADLAVDGHGAGKKVDHGALAVARGAGAEKIADPGFEGFDAEIHGLELRAFRTDERTKGDEPEVMIEFLLAGGAGDDAHVVALFDEVLPHQRHEALEHLAGAKTFVDGEEADFAQGAAGREIGIEVGELLVEGEGTIATCSEHADELTTAHADEVGVLGMEFVHETFRGGGRMLGNLFDEGFVIELVDQIEFPILRGDLENKWGAQFHDVIRVVGLVWVERGVVRKGWRILP
ncbi:MAG: hypothetical protein JWR26_3822 [Pedosphaera sp.]|nr:hypothetical protein [Pedosphaera sp.]